MPVQSPVLVRNASPIAVPFQMPEETVPRYELPETVRAVELAYGNLEAMEVEVAVR